MWKFLIRLTSITFIAICCSTNSFRTIPDLSERQAIRSLSSIELQKKVESKESTPYSEYQARYILAMQLRSTDLNTACDEFSSLANDTAFWAKNLAKIRKFESCPDGHLIPSELDEIRNEPWYYLEYLKIAQKKSIAIQDFESEMRLSYELSLANGNKKDKITLLQRAIQLSKLLKKSTDEVLYTAHLQKIAPRFITSPKQEQYLAVADDLRNSREFKKAIFYYQKVTNSKKASFLDRHKAFDGIAKTYKLQGAKKEYLSSLSKLNNFVNSEWKKKPKDAFLLQKLEESYILTARAQWTEQQVKETQKTLNDLEKKLKNKKGLEQVFWIRGRIEEEAERLDKALDWYSKALLEKNILPTLLESITWQKAWISRKLGKHQEAKETLFVLKESSLTPFSKSKFSYWLAKEFETMGDKDLAKKELEEVIKNDPFSYYALISYRDLNRTIKLDDFKSPPSQDGELLDNPNVSFDGVLFTWLVDVEESEIARSLLEKYISKYPDQKRLYLNFLAMVGMYNHIYGELTNMEMEKRNLFIKENLDYFFPRSFLYDFQNAAQQSGADINILLSITRQESGFDPYARSFADAFGLMQILPEVAQVYAPKLGLDYKTPEDLYNPKINVPIGAAFIQNLFSRFNNSFIPSIASYNASEAAVRNWIKVRYKGQSVEFIEEIPYEETKGYIKLVMRNYVFYSLIQSQNGELVFPEALLNIEL